MSYNWPITLGIVVPCFNEEEVLPETAAQLLSLRQDLIESGKIADKSRIYFVDDGSKDRTWVIIEHLVREQNGAISGIKLSRNRGHQNALLAGMFTADADAVVTVDADLQDDIGVITEMVDDMWEGAEIVYGVRKRRDNDTLFKRLSAEWYYRILKLIGIEAVFNHADFRLLSRRVIDCLNDYSEANLFLRGIIPQVGFKSNTVYYDRISRFAGRSKYNLGKMLALAIDGITSFSAAPLRIIAVLGVAVFLLSLLMMCWVLWAKVMSGSAVPGWASTLIPMYFLGGIQLLSVGVLGEYVAKVYMETKGRPRYIIEKVI